MVRHLRYGKARLVGQNRVAERLVGDTALEVVALEEREMVRLARCGALSLEGCDGQAEDMANPKAKKDHSKKDDDEPSRRGHRAPAAA